MGTDDRHDELIKLLLVDYEATRSRVDAFASASNAVRALGVTVILALVGLAIERRSWALALCAIVSVCLFAVLDAYHGWLYVVSRDRARDLEAIIALRYKALDRVDDEFTIEEFDNKLAAHRFGPHSNVRRFERRFLFHARPIQLYAGLYSVLGVLAIGATIYVARHDSDEANPGDTPTKTTDKPTTE